MGTIAAGAAAAHDTLATLNWLSRFRAEGSSLNGAVWISPDGAVEGSPHCHERRLALTCHNVAVLFLPQYVQHSIVTLVEPDMADSCGNISVDDCRRAAKHTCEIANANDPMLLFSRAC